MWHGDSWFFKCAYIYIHTHIYTYIYMYVYTYTNVYIYSYMLPGNTQECVHVTRVHVYMCMFVCTCVCVCVCVWMCTCYTCTTHRGNQTSNIWISRSNDLIVRSFDWRGLRLLTWKLVSIFRDSHENVFRMYGDSSENLLEILTVVIVWSPISSGCGIYTFLNIKWICQEWLR